MTSTVRSRIEYLLPTANILALLLHSNLILKCNLIDGFSIRFNDIQKWHNFHSATLCVTYRSIGMLCKSRIHDRRDYRDFRLVP